jgi:hypothetical protein
MITDEELAELSRLIVSTPTVRNIARAVNALKPKPAPRVPKPKPPRKTDAEKRHARIVGQIRGRLSRKAAAEAASAAYRAEPKNTMLSWDAINGEAALPGLRNMLEWHRVNSSEHYAAAQATPRPPPESNPSP